MFTIVSSRLPAGDTPVVGVPLEPYVVVRRGELNSTATAEEVPEEGVGDARYSLRFRWFRSTIPADKAVCWVHPDREAAVQCTLCLRSKAETRKSFHCSADCLKQHWPLHKEAHAQPHLGGSSFNLKVNAGHKYSSAGDTWLEVGKRRRYTPTLDDVNCILRCECTAIDSALEQPEVGKPVTLSTLRVRAAPALPKRALVAIPGTPAKGPGGGRFTVLTYNLLADLYASADSFGQHGHCAPWVLSWEYRKQRLLRELSGYGADILCLQEVQSTHYDTWLAPELAKAGYAAVYKKKTTEIYTGSSYAIDGCATFYRRDRFALVKKYEVEFNKAALSLSDGIPAPQRKAALNRLLKDNVALIAVLEALDAGAAQAGAPLRRQLLCVANTHIHANPELNDVKLWQVHTLLKGLEKIAASADIPMLVAGDFNSVPGSAAHTLLVKQHVDPNHPELQNDPLGILRPAAKLKHALTLASAYGALAAAPAAPGPAAAKQRRGIDPNHNEPRFTAIGKDFRGTLDYILYTSDSLAPAALLELPDDGDVSAGGAPLLPNEAWPSDHIALMAEFRYLQA